MEGHTIQVSDSAYQKLLEQSARLDTTPEELIERLLAGDAAESFAEEDVNDIPMRTSEAEALSAVQRLGRLFADVEIDNLEDLLNDPGLHLINVDLDKL